MLFTGMKKCPVAHWDRTLGRWKLSGIKTLKPSHSASCQLPLGSLGTLSKTVQHVASISSTVTCFALFQLTLLQLW